MSQYVFLKQANGEFLKVLADDDGVIQYTTNGDSFSDIVTPSATVTTDTTLSGDGSSGDPLTVLTAPAPANATTFTAALNTATTSLKGLMSAADKASLPTDVAGVLSGGNTISFSALDGNNDGDYEIEFDLICLTNAPGQIYLKINGGTTNQSSAFLYFFGSVGGSTLDPGLSVYSNGSTARVTGFIRLTSKTGKWRSFSCMACDGTPNAVLQVGNYKDTGTNITGVAIVATNANSVDAGSTGKLRKLHKA